MTFKSHFQQNSASRPLYCVLASLCMLREQQSFFPKVSSVHLPGSNPTVPGNEQNSQYSGPLLPVSILYLLGIPVRQLHKIKLKSHSQILFMEHSMRIALEQTVQLATRKLPCYTRCSTSQSTWISVGNLRSKSNPVCLCVCAFVHQGNSTPLPHLMNLQSVHHVNDQNCKFTCFVADT